MTIVSLTLTAKKKGVFKRYREKYKNKKSMGKERKKERRKRDIKGMIKFTFSLGYRDL
jgi:hypothetical protein